MDDDFVRYYERMDTRSDTELSEVLQAAKLQVPIGARYAHYKHPDRFYTVTDIALREDTLEPCVIYKAEYGEGVTFIRSLESFTGATESGAPRFNRL